MVTKNRKEENLLRRITFDEKVLRGKPIIRGMRIPVDMVLELMAKGATTDEILEDYPQLEPEDLKAVLLYAQQLISGETVIDRISL